MQSAEQAKALIAAGEQNRNYAFENMAGYATSAFSGMAKNSKDDENKFQTKQINTRAKPSK